MGMYHIEELIPKKGDKDNILHPRYTRSGIPSVNTFHSVVQDRVGSQYGAIQHWCNENAWFDSSPTCDFWVADAAKYRWGLPVLVPTCPRKMFMQGPRLKYVDIVTDTLHASSSDLITWNTLVMMKLRWFNEIPRQWIDITTSSLEAWEARDHLSQFHNDNRRGYARVTPVALSHIGVPGCKTLPVDEYPKDGLGVYDDFEVCEEFSGYKWATWTTMAAQPMQIDLALQALLNPSGQPGPKYDLGIPANLDLAGQPLGSNACACAAAAPFPDSVEDVSMDSGADKRSRESPDSTLKPEGKSLKTSEATPGATDTDTAEASKADSVKPSNVTKRPKTVPEVKSLMWEVHHRMPAWKADKLIEFHKADQADLAALGETTGILFESRDMLHEAVQCLERIRKEKDGKEDDDSKVPKESDSHSSQSNDQDMSEQGQKVRRPEEAKGVKEDWSAPTAKCPTLLTGVEPSNLKSLDSLLLLIFAEDSVGTKSQDPKSSSHMVSAPRQPVATGNALLTRFDANVRPYWLRDWHS